MKFREANKTFINKVCSQNSIMVKKEKYCCSCKTKIGSLDASVCFDCPNCGKEEIIRCKSCRVRVIKYVCPSCGFEGPN
jgi:Zn-ribbon RNA-binding protein